METCRQAGLPHPYLRPCSLMVAMISRQCISRHDLRQRSGIRWWVAICLAGALSPAVTWAQSITTDGSLGPAQTLVGPNYTISAGLGQQVGGNLFHSFGVFGLPTGSTATFTGPGTATDVLGRVTAGSASSIN